MRTDGQLSTVIEEALRMRDKLKANGATGDTLDAGFEQVVRQHWPFAREWKHLCGDCRDYGLRMKDCPGDASCGRTNPHLPHEYGEPCWCEKGARFRIKPRTDSSAIEDAARVRKPSRFGR